MWVLSVVRLERFQLLMRTLLARKSGELPSTAGNSDATPFRTRLSSRVRWLSSPHTPHLTYTLAADDAYSTRPALSQTSTTRPCRHRLLHGQSGHFKQGHPSAYGVVEEQLTALRKEKIEVNRTRKQ